MTSWALLLRAVNLGPRNRLPMVELRRLLGDLGYDDVATYLNSGNATVTSARRPDPVDVERGLTDRLGLDVRATVRPRAELRRALDAMPAEVGAMPYVLVAFLFAPPQRELGEWEVAPDRLVLGDGVAYLGYAEGVRTSRLQNAALEKRLGVLSTARTPATIRTMLG